MKAVAVGYDLPNSILLSTLSNFNLLQRDFKDLRIFATHQRKELKTPEVSYHRNGGAGYCPYLGRPEDLRVQVPVGNLHPVYDAE